MTLLDVVLYDISAVQIIIARKKFKKILISVCFTNTKDVKPFLKSLDAIGFDYYRFVKSYKKAGVE